MPRICVICRRSQSTSFSVFSFPSSLHQRLAWIKAIRISKPDFAQKENGKLRNGICERHFTKDEMTNGQKKRVKGKATPSLYLQEDFLTPCVEISQGHSNNQISDVSSFETSECIEFNISENGSWKSSNAPCEINNELKNKRDIIISPPIDDKDITQCCFCSTPLRNIELIDVSTTNIKNSDVLIIDFASEFGEIATVDVKPLACPNCINLLEEMNGLRLTLNKKIDEFKNFLNDKCNRSTEILEKTFQTRRSKRSLLVRKTFPCSECASEFSSPAVLSEHLKCHREENKDCKNNSQNIQHRCCNCSMSFLSRKELMRHRNATNCSSDCYVCGRRLTTKARLKLHLFKFHNIGEPSIKSFHCTSCRKSFSTKAGLLYHEKAFHKKGTQYTCKLCDKVFYYNILYKSHMLYIHGEKSVVCEICGAMFFTVSKLNVHINSIHRNAKSWSCNECDAKFTTSWAYKDHISIKHNRMKLSCTYCSAHFSRKSYLTTHLWNHNVFVCQTCDKNLLTADLYASHIKDIHKKNISKKLKRHLKATSSSSDTGQKVPSIAKFAVPSDKSVEINDILMNVDVFNSSNLNSFSFNVRIPLEEDDVSLPNVQMLDDIDLSRDTQLKVLKTDISPATANENLGMSQVFQADLDTEIKESTQGNITQINEFDASSDKDSCLASSIETNSSVTEELVPVVMDSALQVHHIQDFVIRPDPDLTGFFLKSGSEYQTE